MRKLFLFLLAAALSFNSFSQQGSSGSSAAKTLSKEDETALLSLIGGLSATYVINAQDVINNVVELHANKIYTAEKATQQLTKQQAMMRVLNSQITKINDAKILDPATDQIYIDSFVDVLLELDTEIDLYYTYLQKNDAASKSAFEDSRKKTEKQIRLFLGLDK